MHEAQGERIQPGLPLPPGAWAGAARGTTASRQAAPPGSIPARSPGPGQAHPGVPSSCALQAAGTFHPTGVIHTRVSPRCANERRWVAASGSSCNLPPSSPRPETVLLLFFFFFVVPAAAAASPHNHCRPLGGIPWQLCLCPAPRSGGMANTAAHQPSRQQLTLNSKGSPGEERDPCELGTALQKALKRRYREKAKREDCQLHSEPPVPFPEQGALARPRRPGAGKWKGAGAREGSGDGRSKEMRTEAGGALGSPTCGFLNSVAHRNCHSQCKWRKKKFPQ